MAATAVPLLFGPPLGGLFAARPFVIRLAFVFAQHYSRVAISVRPQFLLTVPIAGAEMHCHSFRAPLLLVLVALITGPHPSRAADAPPQVAVTGTVSAKAITTGELLKFTITVQNNTKEPLDSVLLEAAPDSYEFETIQGCGGNPPPYYPSAKAFSQTHGVLMPSVAPGTSCTAWGYLKPTTSHPAATLTVVVEWSSQVGSAPVQRSVSAVSLGENAVASGWDIFTAWFADVAKVLLVPAVLAGLGVWLNLAVQRRDRKRKEAEEKQAARTETLKQMLQTSLDYAAKYYLPLSAAAARLREALQPANPLFDPKAPAVASKYLAPNKTLAFYWLIYLEKRMDEQRKVIGGFYFKELLAEKLASICWKEYAEAIFGKEVDQPLTRAVQSCLNRLDSRENYDAFATKFKLHAHPVYGDRKAREAAVLLDSKLNDAKFVEFVALHLRALEAIIDFEANRPFQYWYEKADWLALTPETQTLLQGIARKLGFSADEMKYFDQARIES